MSVSLDQSNFNDLSQTVLHYKQERDIVENSSNEKDFQITELSNQLFSIQKKLKETDQMLLNCKSTISEQKDQIQYFKDQAENLILENESKHNKINELEIKIKEFQLQSIEKEQIENQLRQRIAKLSMYIVKIRKERVKIKMI